MNQGYWTYYGTLYTILVGPAGNGKSVAQNIAVELLDEIGNVPLSSECLSSRKLMEEMEGQQGEYGYEGRMIKHAPLVCAPDEFSNFVSQNPVMMLDCLTNLWSKKRHRYGTSGKGCVAVEGPSLTLLTCAVPDWITTNLKNDVVTGGFSRRALWIYETGRSRDKVIPRPTVNDAMKLQWATLISKGREIQRVKGEFKWTEDSEMFWDEWYIENKGKSEILTGYRESKPGLVLKLAMLYDLSDEGKLIITSENIDRADKVLEQIEKNIHLVFEGIGRNELNPVANRIISLLENGNGAKSEVGVREVMYKYCNSRELDDVLLHLIRIKRISSNNGLIKLCEKKLEIVAP